MSVRRSLPLALLEATTPDRALAILAAVADEAAASTSSRLRNSGTTSGTTSDTTASLSIAEEDPDPLIASIASAASQVVHQARAKGQSLEEVMAEVLAEDSLLDGDSRRWLSDLVAQVWNAPV